MEVYRTSNLKGDAKILLQNFYIGLALHHRQLLDFAAKGSFIELDANSAYEILEGILGIPPVKKGITFTQEGVQILDKLNDLHKHMVDLQKQHESLKRINGSINRMNTLISLCNKRLDILDLRMVSFLENLGKRKEPPRFDKMLAKVAKITEDDKT
jgi:hypothetical protein